MSKAASKPIQTVIFGTLALIAVLFITVLTLIPSSRFIEVVATATQIGILVVLALTLIPIRKTFAVQLLRDRYEMFFDSWEVKEEDVRQFRAKQHLFVEKKRMDPAYLEALLGDKTDNAIKDYLLVVQLYEYLAFAHTFNTNREYLGKSFMGKCRDRFRNCLEPEAIDPLCPKDPYGEPWVKRLVAILITENDRDFPHVHESYKDDHREFYCFVEKMKKDLGCPADPDCDEYIRKYEDAERG
ncbi:MAG: hypothetical protein WBG50_18890 [Desulfomonilaceae bacterium]